MDRLFWKFADIWQCVSIPSIVVVLVLLITSTELVYAESIDPIDNSTNNPRLAPVNPDFLQQLRLRSTPLQPQAHATGYFPSPVDRSRMTGLKPEVVRTSTRLKSYPSSFDLRVSGMVTSVKNQETCNDCWSFSSIASVESQTLTNGGSAFDFSENHQNVRHGFDWPPCGGGNGDMAGAYMSRWRSVDAGNPDAPQAAGLVYETDDPYTNVAATSIPGLYPRVHLQEFLILPDRASGSDNDNYKYALQNYGAIDIGIYADDGMSRSTSSDFWNQATKAYYYTGSTIANHAVALVGWDDSYPASNFRTQPPGNGAFIAKNQWGTDWGDRGYFYVSYYDSQLKDAHVFRPPESNINYAHSYFYDPFGRTLAYGYASGTGWGANVFSAIASENLKAVAFNTTTVSTSYEVSIYTGVFSDPATGTLENGTVNTTGAFDFAGYHTVVLSRPVPLTAGQKFAVVIKFTTPGYPYQIPLEEQISGYDSAASASAGQSYVSFDGAQWTDIVTQYPNANVTIRAFTAQSVIAPIATTGIATNITATGATLNGQVNSNGNTVAVSFDLGADTNYGRNLAVGTINSGSAVAVHVDVPGLTCGTIYHYRVKAVVGTATPVYGSDMALTTATCPVSSPGDANGDGKTNSLDLIAVANQILGITNAKGSPDCNVDTKVNSLDLICIANKILGL